MVQLTKGKRWERVKLAGTEEFRGRAAQVSSAASIALDDPELGRMARCCGALSLCAAGNGNCGMTRFPGLAGDQPCNALGIAGSPAPAAAWLNWLGFAIIIY